MNLAVSTLAFGKTSREEVVQIAQDQGFTIEFSSSFPYQEDMVEYFLDADINRLAHNYFPAPQVPFVINLASRDTQIREKSVQHCLQGLRISKACGAPYFSAHAGFCIDPDPEQLGKQLDINAEVDRTLNWSIFLDSVEMVLKEAEKLGISFLIENNVTARFNLREDGQEILFCSRPAEMMKLADSFSANNFGLLLDTAHLKVSSQALEFDLDEAVMLIKDHVKYIHHSDNDGATDSNSPISDHYWFLPWMVEFSDCIHVLEVKNQNLDEIITQLKMLQAHG